MRKIITFGTFDVLHIGHIRILKRAREHGDHLIVGLSSDQLNFSKKGRNPVYPFASREELLTSMRLLMRSLKKNHWSKNESIFLSTMRMCLLWEMIGLENLMNSRMCVTSFIYPVRLLFQRQKLLKLLRKPHK